VHVSRVNHGFRFSCPTATELFEVRMTLHDDGSEKLHTVVRETNLNLSAARLDSGSVERLLGPNRWKAFLRLRSSGHKEMLL